MFTLRIPNKAKRPLQSRFNNARLRVFIVIAAISVTVYFSYSLATYLYEHESSPVENPAGR